MGRFLFQKHYLSCAAIGVTLAITSITVQADGGVMFHDIAAGDSAGIDYRRTRSLNDAPLQAMKESGFFDFAQDSALVPVKGRGAPGVAIFDFDNDGDQDIYVTNGPGTANSLYSNQFSATGQVSFVDMAGSAGVALTSDDSTGVCFGDIDNDGDKDLLVVSNGYGARLLVNNGDGSFTDHSQTSGIDTQGKHSSGCAMGDVDNDGWLDVAVGNTYDNWSHRLPLFVDGFSDLQEHNQLFLNRGKHQFEDVSGPSGLQALSLISWVISLVDIDQDGDVDIVTGDDHGARPRNVLNGSNDGFVRVMLNDGTGVFTDVSEQVGTNRAGAWMGLAFGDFDQNGAMDIYGTNTGYFMAQFLNSAVGFPIQLGDWASGPFLADENGQFTFPGVGDLVGGPFGWGVVAADYDNDGDTDIIYHGGMDMGPFQDGSNPGVILQNQGQAQFTYDDQALANSTDHIRRNVQGVGVGDLNEDGFVDIVSVSNQDWPTVFPTVPYLPPELMAGTPFDPTATIWPIFVPVDPMDPFGLFAWTGLEPGDGTLSIEISSGDNDNKWVKVRLMGSAGLVNGGKVNRDGIGAVVKFTPHDGNPAIKPVLGGSSYASQNSLDIIFGLGEESDKGVIEVLWPGGIRNRLYHARAGSTVMFPEIPCDIAAQDVSFSDYKRCVKDSLKNLRHAGHLNRHEMKKFFFSAMRAFREEHRESSR